MIGYIAVAVDDCGSRFVRVLSPPAQFVAICAGDAGEGYPHVEEKGFPQKPILLAAQTQIFGEHLHFCCLHNVLLYAESFLTRPWGNTSGRTRANESKEISRVHTSTMVYPK